MQYPTLSPSKQTRVITDVFTGDWEGAWNAVKDIFAAVWDAILAILTVAWERIKLTVTIGLGLIKGLWEAIWNAIKSFFLGIWNRRKIITHLLWALHIKLICFKSESIFICHLLSSLNTK